MIAFSTDANVAARGVYLLSFLPESDVERIVGYAAAQGKPLVRRADSRQCLWQRGRGAPSSRRWRAAAAASSRSSAIPRDKAQMQAPVRTVAQAAAASRADAIFIPDGADAVPAVVQTLTANGVDTKRVQLLGTGLWEDPQIFSSPALDGAWYAAPGLDRLPQLLRPLPHAATGRTRCAPPRSPMTRSRWSRRW